MDSNFGMVSAPSRVPVQRGTQPVLAATAAPVAMAGDVYTRSGAGAVAPASTGGLGGVFQRLVDLIKSLFAKIGSFFHGTAAPAAPVAAVAPIAPAPVAPGIVAPSPVAPTPATPAPVAPAPGAQVPGALVPGAQLPGALVPGAQLPGAPLPGAPVPGAVVPGAVAPGAVPSPVVPGAVLPTPPVAPPPPPPPPPPPAPVPPPVATPAPPAAPAPTPAPANAKPPILQQFIQKGDPTVGVYGASGATWIGGASEAEIKRVIGEAKAQNQTPVIVQYDIPNRDKGGGSAGGAANAQAYLDEVTKNAKAIGDAPAVVILEPDALALDLDPALIKQAVQTYKTNAPNARIYVDAGNCAWMSVDEAVDRLIKGGIADADGFSLNVSGFWYTNETTAYGDKIVDALVKKDPKLAGKQFVVDTSRNGNGPGVDETGKQTWGDPVKALNGGPIMTGPMPNTKSNDPNVAALLWIKPPGWGDFRNRSAHDFGGAAWVTPNRNAPLGPNG